MTRSLVISLGLIAVLCALAPWASQAPDTIQKLLGLPGGAGTLIKAVEGVLATVAVIFILGQVMRYLKTHRL